MEWRFFQPQPHRPAHVGLHRENVVAHSQYTTPTVGAKSLPPRAQVPEFVL